MVVQYALPVHKILGSQFKFFIDTKDASLVDETIRYLESKGAKNVEQSKSGERQRVYFTVDVDGIISHVTRTKDVQIINNYVFPV